MADQPTSHTATVNMEKLAQTMPAVVLITSAGMVMNFVVKAVIQNLAHAEVIIQTILVPMDKSASLMNAVAKVRNCSEFYNTHFEIVYSFPD